MLVEKARLNTFRVVATRLGVRALSNVWWPVSLRDEDELASKALVLWLNSTLGLLVMWSLREETEGAWMGFKKPVLASMPVPDFRVIQPDQLARLAAAFDELAGLELQPFPEMAQDAVRAGLDAAVADALSLPDFTILREMLAREPIVCLKRIVDWEA